MKNLYTILLAFLPALLLQTSCVKGCIDDNALNYDPEATANSGCAYPETVTILSIGVITHNSFDSNGSEWDADGGADKFIKILNNETNALLYTTEVEEFLPVTWVLSSELSLDALNTVIRIELYDQDDTEDVFMDQAILDLESLTGTTASTSNDLYPESGTISGENNTSFVLNMNWTE